MSKVTELKSERLVLRQWRDEDFPLFAKINADPDVMEFYPNSLTEVESNILGRKIESWINERGWGFWAVELIGKQKFIGFVGLHKPAYELPVTPCIELVGVWQKRSGGKGMHPRPHQWQLYSRLIILT